jgi:hypothetical protein
VWLVVVFHYCSYLGGGGVSRVGKSSGCTRLRLWYALVSTSVILNHCIKTRFLVCISSKVLSYRRRKNVKDSLRSESGYEVCVRRHACQMKETKDCFAG